MGMAPHTQGTPQIDSKRSKRSTTSESWMFRVNELVHPTTAASITVQIARITSALSIQAIYLEKDSGVVTP